MTTAYTIPILKLSLVRDGKVCVSEAPQARSSNGILPLLRAHLDGVDREHFIVVLLSQKNRVIGIHTASVGSLTNAVVHPREVFKAAIVGNAAAIICAHNHPSGDPAPSQEDRALTARLVAAGKLLGIAVLDHIIIGDPTYFSFADEGCLES